MNQGRKNQQPGGKKSGSRSRGSYSKAAVGEATDSKWDLSDLQELKAQSMDDGRLRSILDNINHMLELHINTKDHLKLNRLKEYFEQELRHRQ